jgi:hypothetical protein
MIGAGFVCLCVIYTIAFQRYGGPWSTGAAIEVNTALPYQVLFRDLPGDQQRVFRAMQEGVTEALRMRAESGSWPSVASLAAAGIPPFAPDVLDRAGLRWSRRDATLLIEYVGVPSADAGMPAFLILIQEPGPGGGERPSPSVLDEEHQMLPDGTLLHVTYWKRSPDSLPAGLVPDPALEGWSQIRVNNPSIVVEKP